MAANGACWKSNLDTIRYWIHLDEGRVQGITATGIQSNEITDRLPDALKELAPVLNVTLGNSGSELNGIVDLLNTNVLDPRLLRKTAAAPSLRVIDYLLYPRTARFQV